MSNIKFNMATVPEKIKALNIYALVQKKTDENGHLNLDDGDKKLLAEFIVWNWAHEGVPYGNAEGAVQGLMELPADELAREARLYDGAFNKDQE